MWMIFAIPIAVSAVAKIFEVVSEDREVKRKARMVKQIADVASVIAFFAAPYAMAPKSAQVVMKVARAVSRI